LTEEESFDWNDLTEQEKLYVVKQAANGIHLTAQMVKNISTEIVYNPIQNLQDAVWQALNISLIDPEGRTFTPIKIRNPIFDGVGMKPPNLDFMKLWETGRFKISVNLPKGFLGMSTHGDNPYVKDEIRPDEENDLCNMLLAKYFLESENAWRWKKGKIPKAAYFARKDRKKIEGYYRLFKQLDKDRRRQRRAQKKMPGHFSGIYG
jgi:hypothetical protein